MRKSSFSLGTRWYGTECPRRQAYCANAQASQDLPTAVGPVNKLIGRKEICATSLATMTPLCHSGPFRYSDRSFRSKPKIGHDRPK
jgi:hypothetical protein